ncbi:MAG TPA: hypothetical protein VHW03_04500 [Chthoniobacterales bacterium]|jgi:hypothetical protein|nr:hypothetical protein [Chthoniobacterales bacterium]
MNVPTKNDLRLTIAHQAASNFALLRIIRNLSCTLSQTRVARDRFWRERNQAEEERDALREILFPSAPRFPRAFDVFFNPLP